MTKGELAFERFCSANRIPCERIDNGPTSTPDFRIQFGTAAVFVEVKDIEEDENFGQVQRRTHGSHVRAKIEEARVQLQPLARAGFPTILVIFNTLDPFQAFGTEPLDFMAGMYGELHAQLDKSTKQIRYFLRGKNKSFRADKNTSFSAVCGLYTRDGRLSLTLYENVFAKTPLNFDTLPSCFDFQRIVLEEE
jgi:hypothetical protein